MVDPETVALRFDGAFGIVADGGGGVGVPLPFG